MGHLFYQNWGHVLKYLDVISEEQHHLELRPCLLFPGMLEDHSELGITGESQEGQSGLISLSSLVGLTM